MTPHVRSVQPRYDRKERGLTRQHSCSNEVLGYTEELDRQGKSFLGLVMETSRGRCGSQNLMEGRIKWDKHVDRFLRLRKVLS